MDKDTITKLIDERIKVSQGFTSRKLGDTPTDDLQLTPRGYVNMNGLVASRPNSSVVTLGQHYFATDTSQLMVWTGTQWVNGAGSVVALT